MRSNKAIEKTCGFCGIKFYTDRRKSKWCSDTCKVKAHQKRKSEQSVNTSVTEQPVVETKPIPIEKTDENEIERVLEVRKDYAYTGEYLTMTDKGTCGVCGRENRYVADRINYGKNICWNCEQAIKEVRGL